MSYTAFQPHRYKTQSNAMIREGRIDSRCLAQVCKGHMLCKQVQLPPSDMTICWHHACKQSILRHWAGYDAFDAGSQHLVHWMLRRWQGQYHNWLICICGMLGGRQYDPSRPWHILAGLRDHCTWMSLQASVFNDRPYGAISAYFAPLAEAKT